MKRHNTSEAAYAKSNSIETVALQRFSKTEYKDLLKDGDRQRKAQALVNYLCGKFHIPTVPVFVVNTPQPHATNGSGNLRSKTLGTYTHSVLYSKITMYNLTAVKKQTVSIKTFAGTLLHEFMHHYDIHYLKMDATPHTAGFYKRISDLEGKLSD